MHDPLPTNSDYCSTLARAKGLDPIGYGGMFNNMVLLEVPLPWSRSPLTDPEKVTPEFVQALERYFALPQAERPSVRPLAIAPDAAYAEDGRRRFVHFTRQTGAIAHFTRHEYCVPEAIYGALVWAALIEPDKLSAFESYCVPENGLRDILVCTHGSVDAACAKFGYPLYRHLRENFADTNLRVWRCSHFGGHVFAPTCIDMPIGHYWAYVDTQQGTQIAQRSGDPRALRAHYRGWAALNHSFLQAAEREAFMREGWQWLTYRKAGVLLAHDSAENPQWGEVRLTFSTADGKPLGRYEGRVEVECYLTTIPSTGSEQPYRYAQYKVVNLDYITH